MANLQDWLSGKTTNDPQPLTLDDAGRLLNERARLSLQRYWNGLYIAGPLVHSYDNSPSPTVPAPAPEQAPLSLYTGFRTLAPSAAHSPTHHNGPTRPARRPGPYPSGGKRTQDDKQANKAVEKKKKQGRRAFRQVEWQDYREASSAGAGDDGLEDVAMELDEMPAADHAPTANDSDSSSSAEDNESPVTPALVNASEPTVRGNNNEDADAFAADDGMDVADDADRAKYSDVNRKLTANDFYFPSSPASSSSSIHTAAHADEASVTPALANLPAPDIPGFGDFVMYDGVNDGATPAGDAKLEHSANATREPTANAALQSHTASAVAAPIPPPPFVLTVHPPSPRLDEVDEDELRQAHAALNKDGKIWLDCTATGFIIAFINSGEAITSLSLEYMDPREGDLGLTIRLVDNLARDTVFTNVETDMLSHLQNSSTILACTEVSIELSLRTPHYHALATTTLPRVTLLRVKVSRNQDSDALDDDLVVLRLPLVQTIMHCVPPPAVSDFQASAFVNSHIEHDGTALVFAM
ncbi:hypothetical protein EXIGLDRAFT_747033 [Exidia glandulosa HHB12029]|uniref:Uncharacterized protein n=1 Tax=Exidia glandulosa HHB12029 TaxID=1314781 RepID=A0A165L8U0_EXIGL|nr:hypothetical protein EXIGLDRAFT_747033 [Exidia glandulosa HHB12029]